MPGKLTSELEKVLQNLKDKRKEERQELLSSISEKERRIQDLLAEIEAVKKNHAAAQARLKQEMTRQKTKFSNELGIANEKVRIVEDDNLKFQAELEAVKRQLDMEKNLREESKRAHDSKMESLSRNYENLLDGRQKEIAALEQKIVSLQERFSDDIGRERSKSETALQLVKSELEGLAAEYDAAKVKFSAQRKDMTKTIQEQKHEVQLLKSEIKESAKKIKVQQEDYEMQMKNLDREWSEVLRKKEKDIRETEARIKTVRKEVDAQVASQLKELESEKRELADRIIELESRMEEQALAHERKLVEKDEAYRNQIAKLRDQQIDLQTQYQKKEDELNMIRSELESEISAITGSAGASAAAPVRENKKEKEEKGIKKAIGGIFSKKKRKKEDEKKEPDLFAATREPVTEEPGEEKAPAAGKSGGGRIEDEKTRQIGLILEQKKETIRELEGQLDTADEELKKEIQNRIDSLKVEIEKWQTRR